MDQLEVGKSVTVWQQTWTPAGRTALWKKYRRSILIGVGVVGVGALGAGAVWYWSYSQRLQEKEQELRRIQLELEARRAEEQEKARLQQEVARADEQLQTHFESIQLIADGTTLPSVIPHLKTRLFALIDLSALTQALVANRKESSRRSQPGTPQQLPLTAQEKMQIWEDLKVLSFSRALGSMWAVALLFLFVRTQLNILGRHVYIHTAAEDPAPESATGTDAGADSKLTMSCQHKFIAFSDYLPHCGLAALLQEVERTMKGALQTRSLKDKFTWEQLKTLLWDLRAEFEVRQTSRWHQYLLPANNILPADLAVASSAADVAQAGSSRALSEAASASDADEHAVSMRGSRMADAMAASFAASQAETEDEPEGSALDENAAGASDDAALTALMTETRGVLSSQQFRRALSAAMDAITEGAMEELRGTAFASGSADPSAPVPPIGIALAKLLPPVAAVAVTLLEHEDNSFVARLSRLEEITSFSAMVYAGTVEKKALAGKPQ